MSQRRKIYDRVRARVRPKYRQAARALRSWKRMYNRLVRRQGKQGNDGA